MFSPISPNAGLYTGKLWLQACVNNAIRSSAD